MPCFHPLDATRIPTLSERPELRHINKFKISFRPADRMLGMPIKIPCGQCVGCRLERSRQWAIRCVHEASLHQKNCFITLTFSPEYLATRSNQWSLDVVDWQKFMYRFRKKYGKNIRFYHCGEYGQMCATCDQSLFNCKCGPASIKTLGRPHYHACIFGFDFPDKEFFRQTDSGHILYTSKSLEKLWTAKATKNHPKMQMGFCTIGDVTFESAAYVARYIMKKITGDADKAEAHYMRHDTGEILKPEYTTMSRRPGIARHFLDKYMDDIYPHDFVVLNNKKMRPPRYYDGVLKTERPYTFDDVKFNREENSKKHVDNNTPERLKTREAIQLETLKLLPRNKDL